MKIYTSYYSKIKSVSLDDKVLVPVSNTVPDWFNTEYYKTKTNLSPKWDLINLYKNGNVDYKYFSFEYEKYLYEHFEKEEVLQELEQLAERMNVEYIVLLCYEKNAEKCHRSVLGKWLGGSYLGEL